MPKQTPGLPDTLLGTNELTGRWGREKASNAGASGLTPAVALRLGACFVSLLKPPSYFYLLLLKFQETPVIVLWSREVLSQYISPCLHRLLFCFSLVHDAKVCQNHWLSTHEIKRTVWRMILLSCFQRVSQLVCLSHSRAWTLSLLVWLAIQMYTLISVLLFSVQTTSVQGDFSLNQTLPSG